MKLILMLNIFLLLTACGSGPSGIKGEVYLSQGDLFIATQELDHQSYLYHYKLSLSGVKLAQTQDFESDDLTIPVALASNQEGNELYVANANRVATFSLNASKKALSPERVFKIPEHLGSIKDIHYFDQELFVLLSEKNAIAIFDINVQDEAFPKRVIHGEKTMLSHPSAMSIADQEIFIVNGGSDSSIIVFQLSDEGDINPIRFIAGNHTRLLNPAGIAVNIEDRLIYVTNQDNSILRFNLEDSGNVPYTGKISGAKTMLNKPGQLIFDPHAKTLIVCNSSFESILTFPIQAVGNLPPSFILSGIEGASSLALFR